MPTLHVTELLSNRCGHCNTLLTTLHHCTSACHVQTYCSEAHLTLDRAVHTSTCQAIVDAQRKRSESEAALRSSNPEIFNCGHGHGHFWELEETRDYVDARMGLVNALGCVNNRISDSTRLMHLEDLISLCRTDLIGLREEIPDVLLRLGQDQECYDFIVWWTRAGKALNRGWDGNEETQPFLDTRVADVFESLESCFGVMEEASTQHLLDVLLIKVRLLLDARQLLRLPQSPQATDAEIRVLSHITAARHSSITPEVAERLADQIKTLHRAVHGRNEFFWDVFLNYDATVLQEAEDLKFPFGTGTRQEALLMLKKHLPAWKDTPGAFDVVGDGR